MKKFIPWIIVILVLTGTLASILYVAVFKRDVEVSGGEEEGIERIRPRSMKITETGSDYFVVEWETRDSVAGYVKYGDTSSSISLLAQDVKGAEPTEFHKVRVGQLVPGRKYYFWVMSDDIAFGRNGRALEVLTLSE
ncbi:fibronectin type III domain-containing protein [Candidatus Dojkabacteria bacterium]|nr:fibronectin type III domain-containing protein [Candidatus Dojkabacteria bacterium]